MQHAFILNETEYNIGLSRAREGYRLHVAGASLPVQLKPGEEGGWVLSCGDTVRHLAIAVDGDDVWIHLDGETHQLRFEHALQRLAQMNEAAGADAIKAAMPGSLISLSVEVGSHVKKGQILLMMESMKMETTLTAPRDGVVADIRVAPGQTFDKGALLLSLEPEGE